MVAPAPRVKKGMRLTNQGRVLTAARLLHHFTRRRHSQHATSGSPRTGREPLGPAPRSSAACAGFRKARQASSKRPCKMVEPKSGNDRGSVAEFCKCPLFNYLRGCFDSISVKTRLRERRSAVGGGAGVGAGVEGRPRSHRHRSRSQVAHPGSSPPCWCARVRGRGENRWGQAATCCGAFARAAPPPRDGAASPRVFATGRNGRMARQ